MVERARRERKERKRRETGERKDRERHTKATERSCKLQGNAPGIKVVLRGFTGISGDSRVYETLRQITRVRGKFQRS